MSDGQKKEIDRASVLAEKSLAIDLTEFINYLVFNIKNNGGVFNTSRLFFVEEIIGIANEYRAISKFGKLSYSDLQTDCPIFFNPRQDDNKSAGL